MKPAALVGRFLIVAVITSAVLTLGATLGLVATESGAVRSIGWIFAQMGTFFAVSLPFVLVAGALFGVPARILLKQNAQPTLALFVVAGACIGAVAGIVVLGLFLTSLAASVPAGILGLVGGFTASLCWWFLVERHVLADAHA